MDLRVQEKNPKDLFLRVLRFTGPLEPLIKYFRKEPADVKNSLEIA